jgi:hypothetical protein
VKKSRTRLYFQVSVASEARHKDYKIGIGCFSGKHAALKGKSKDSLARNQDNVSEWGDISNRGLLFNQCLSPLKL